MPVHRFRSIDEMKARLKEEVTVLSYDFRLYKQNLLTTQINYFASQRAFKPHKIFDVNARIIDDKVIKRMTFEWFLLPCQKGLSCQTIIMMACPEDQFEESRPAFEYVVASLRGHDYYN